MSLFAALPAPDKRARARQKRGHSSVAWRSACLRQQNALHRQNTLYHSTLSQRAFHISPWVLLSPTDILWMQLNLEPLWERSAARRRMGTAAEHVSGYFRATYIRGKRRSNEMGSRSHVEFADAGPYGRCRIARIRYTVHVREKGTSIWDYCKALRTDGAERYFGECRLRSRLSKIQV
jgi:hypothetical protein